MTTFLQGPGVSVRVGEVRKARIVATLGVQPHAPSSRPGFDRVLVPDRADVDAAADQFRPFGREVARNEAQVMQAATRVSRDQVHRTRGPGWGELHNSEIGGGAVVDVQDEADLFGVERTRAVDVSYRQRDDLQGEHGLL